MNLFKKLFYSLVAIGIVTTGVALAIGGLICLWIYCIFTGCDDKTQD